jgi:parallel beta-helix repeat protein
MLINSDRNKILSNNASGNSTGINLASGYAENYNDISYNTASENTSDGIVVEGDSYHNSIRGNTMAANAGWGLLIGFGANYNIYADNHVLGNGQTQQIFDNGLGNNPTPPDAFGNTITPP